MPSRPSAASPVAVGGGRGRLGSALRDFELYQAQQSTFFGWFFFCFLMVTAAP